MATKKQDEKKARNDENIQQVVDVLTTANYRAGRDIRSGHGHVEFWVGPGRVPVIALQYYANNDGFELYVPITQSNRMDETLYALRDATNIPRDVHAAASVIANGPAGDPAHRNCTSEHCFAGGDCPVR